MDTVAGRLCSILQITVHVKDGCGASFLGPRQDGLPFSPSPATRDNPGLIHRRWNTLADFLRMYADANEANYTYPTESLASQLRVLPDGAGLKSVGRAEATRPGGHWGYRQGTFIADLTLPARTVTGSASQDWVRWNGALRRLTLREVMMLQGFPVDWDVRGLRPSSTSRLAMPSQLCLAGFWGAYSGDPQ